MRRDERQFFGAAPGRTVEAHGSIGAHYRSDGGNRGALPYLKKKEGLEVYFD